jgi:hypothetical protein
MGSAVTSGMFVCEEGAAMAYNEAAVERNGEYAVLNINPIYKGDSNVNIIME